MRTFTLFAFFIFLGVCYGAPLDPEVGEIDEVEPARCRIVIEKDGIESGGVVSAWGGDRNEVYCKVECTGKSVAPAVRWYRQKGSSWRQLKSYSNQWVYAVRKHFDTWSVLNFPNFLKKHVGQYKCTAWLGEGQRWQSKDVYVSYGCPPNSFFCDNFMCLPKSKTCDGIKHCKDGRDEANCLKCDPIDEFSCDGKCMAISNRCDGFMDCIDEADEKGCVCNETTQFTCDDGSCIENTLVCDGFEDCLMDGSDEYPELCDSEPSSTTTEEITTTAGTTTTTEPTTETSSTTTTTTTTTTSATTTTTTTTAPTTTVTDEDDYYNYIYDYGNDGDGDNANDNDNANDGDNDYEYGVDDDSIQESTTQQDGHGETITTTTKPSKPTTVEVDVDSTTEEEVIGPGCIPDVEFQCNNGQCIPMDWFCDSYMDCYDNEDETNCTTSQDGCLESQFQCDEGMCIPESSECDGVLDCPFGEDEEGCDGCLPNQFMCNDGECVDIDRRCDTLFDCNDTSDEQNCFKDGGVTCLESKIQCDDGLKCYTTEERCDGSIDCLDGTDEKNCPTASPTESPSGSPGEAGVGNGEVVSGEITIIETGNGKVIIEEELPVDQ